MLASSNAVHLLFQINANAADDTLKDGEQITIHKIDLSFSRLQRAFNTYIGRLHSCKPAVVLNFLIRYPPNVGLSTNKADLTLYNDHVQKINIKTQ